MVMSPSIDSGEPPVRVPESSCSPLVGIRVRSLEAGYVRRWFRAITKGAETMNTIVGDSKEVPTREGGFPLALDQCPNGRNCPTPPSSVRGLRRDRLGGLIHEYSQVA